MKKFKKGSSLLLMLTLLCPTVLGSTGTFAESVESSSTEVSVGMTAETTVETTEKLEENNSAKETPEKSKTIPIQMLGVNDFHGALDTTGTAYFPKDSFKNVGRASVLSAYLDKAEGTFKSAHSMDVTTERIQAGDLVGASPANSALLRDEPTMKVFNQMGFTLGTLGNHEFDKGLGEFMRILYGEEPKRENMGSISDTLWEAIHGYPREKSTQQIVVANIKNKVDGEHGKVGEQPYGLPPYVIKTYGEGEEAVKVGYIGVVTKEFPNLVLAEHTEDFEVIDEGEAVAQYSKELREKQGVNAIVVISHVAATSEDDLAQGEVVEMMDLVEELDPENSVDLVFAGHNHQYTNGVIPREGKNDVRVVQSTSQGKAYIDVQGELDVETKDFKETPKAEVVPTVGADITPDAEVQATVDHASEIIKPITNEAVGRADLDKVTDKDGQKMITRATNEHDESELGNLITDGQLYMANNSGLKDSAGNEVKADFALTNSGGIRADLLINDKGEITWGAAQTVQPFGNILQVVEMTGKDIKEVLNQQYNNGKTGYTLQVSGLTYAYTGTAKTADGSYKVVDVRLPDRTPVVDDKKYNVIINDFLFGGGDGFTAFTKGKLIAAMDTDTDTFVDYFKAIEAKGEKVSSPKLGRKQLQTITAEELQKETKVDVIRKGDKVISGKSVPGAEVGFTKINGDVLGTGEADQDGKFEVKLSEAVTEKAVNFFVKVGPTELNGPEKVVFPEGDYISDGRYVEMAKKNYDIWSDFNWKPRQKSDALMGQVLQARGRYEHENGQIYYSLYDNKGAWQGYINAAGTKKGSPQGDYISDGRYVTISNKNYDTWTNFAWKKRGKTADMFNMTYQARGRYEHFNGLTYLSLYDNKGKWHGYLNENAVKVGNGKQGAYISDGRYVTIVKDNYEIWSNFNWKKRTTSKLLYNETYQVKGKYNHINGSTYYSLYDDKGVWKGYINANATKLGDGKQGAYIPYGKKVEITKKGYKTWSNFNWKERYKTDKMIGVQFNARGVYYHANGSTYYSLYDNKGTWHGYINANAARVR